MGMSYGLFLDLVIIVLLGATIFYAMRLTRYLEQFRSNRADMERLIRDLSMQITRAQEGIGTLDNLAKESSDELRTLLNKGRSLSDELQLITEAGDSLATRLEQLSVRARAGTMASEESYESQYESPAREAPVFAAPSRSAPSSASLFAIRDPDFEHDDDGTDDDLGSQAEKDLARALRKRNK
jgi:Domain of unknown function (DUF6468)